MALRSEALLALGLIAATAALSAQPFEFPARQKRLWRDKPATLLLDDAGIAAKREGESRRWSWEDVQQLTLARNEIRVLTYTDSTWQAGRDREWIFDRIPEGIAETLYPFLATKMEGRLVAAIAVVPEDPLWRIPAKLHSGFGGPEGTLIRGRHTVVFRTQEGNDSRTWRIDDIEGVSSDGPSDIEIVATEHRGLLRSSPSAFRFQLKRPLSADRFQELWRQVHRSSGLRILQSYTGEAQ